MSSVAVERSQDADALAIEQTLISGDLSRLTIPQRLSFYNQVCASLDLNPLTKPFAYITLNGKLTLYALKDCTEQLRSKRSISVQIVAREVVEDCYVVTARASTPAGRQDESIGAVPIANLKGENKANALMKAETKAKRRVTLSICGLGMLDETEVESIHQAPAAERAVVASSASHAAVTPVAPKAGGSEQSAVIDTTTGEERPAPPKGYFYVQGYNISNGWHEFHLLNYDLQGGSIKLSTKKQIGSLAAQAEAAGVPVKVTTSAKKNARGTEAYLDTIETWKGGGLPDSLKPFAKDPAPLEAGVCAGCGLPFKDCTCALDAPF